MISLPSNVNVLALLFQLATFLPSLCCFSFNHHLIKFCFSFPSFFLSSRGPLLLLLSQQLLQWLNSSSTSSPILKKKIVKEELKELIFKMEETSLRLFFCWWCGGTLTTTLIRRLYRLKTRAENSSRSFRLATQYKLTMRRVYSTIEKKKQIESEVRDFELKFIDFFGLENISRFFALERA